MVNVVWALAKTDYAGNGSRRSRTLLDLIAKSAMSQMEAFTPEQLSRLLWAFSTLHHYHEDLYQAIAAETLQQVCTAYLAWIAAEIVQQISIVIPLWCTTTMRTWTQPLQLKQCSRRALHLMLAILLTEVGRSALL